MSRDGDVEREKGTGVLWALEDVLVGEAKEGAMGKDG